MPNLALRHCGSANHGKPKNKKRKRYAHAMKRRNESKGYEKEGYTKRRKDKIARSAMAKTNARLFKH